MGDLLSRRMDRCASMTSVQVPPSTADRLGAARLLANDVVVRFGGLVALDGISISAPVGDITGLIGPNGAGKTTLFNVCCGYQIAQQGTVSLDDVDITHTSPVKRARAGIGRTFQRLELFWSMSVRENVELAAEAQLASDDPRWLLGIRARGARYNKQRRAAADHALEMVGLVDRADANAGQLSTAQCRLLELARCLAREPRILLLDEPSSGLDTSETARFGDLICQLVEDTGVGILLVEHDMKLVLRICQRITVLDFGKLLFEGKPDEVQGSSEVQSAYLGQSIDATDAETMAQ
jgi:ABC-type branched-subunit amino acid transport system ATPase component